jgi:putative lipoprotein
MRRRPTLIALGLVAGAPALPRRAPTAGAAQGPTAVTGEAFYRERIALPPDTVFRVQLQDVSLADAPATTLSEVTTDAAGAGPPFPFSLPYDPAQIDERFTYAVRADVSAAGRLLFTTTQHYPVITHGNPTAGLLLLMEMVPAGGQGAGPGPGPGGGAGLGPRARDGQSLRTQPAAVQAAFEALWGDQAGARWVAEHEAELARQGR